MARKLKHFAYKIGWGTHRGDIYYIVATSRKQVIELMGKVNVRLTLHELKNFGKLWGNNAEELMKSFDLTKPCVYLGKENQGGIITGSIKKIL